MINLVRFTRTAAYALVLSLVLSLTLGISAQGKKPAGWPDINFQYAGPQLWYLGEDSVTGSVSWRGEGPLEAGKIVTLKPPMYLEMSNTALKITLNGKGNDSGLQLYADSPTAGSIQDNVPNRFVGLKFADQGLVIAIMSHSPEGGSHNPGPHAWNISMVSPKKTTANILIQAIYKQATAQYPREYEMDYGELSGPFCAHLVELYGPHN